LEALFHSSGAEVETAFLPKLSIMSHRHLPQLRSTRCANTGKDAEVLVRLASTLGYRLMGDFASWMRHYSGYLAYAIFSILVQFRFDTSAAMMPRWRFCEFGGVIPAHGTKFT
jgi:hypothetical protein